MSKRILLVDDEPVIVKMVQRRLEAAGYEVWTAMDGEQVFEVMNAGRPDLVVLDLMLPKINGFEVAQRLKADPATKAIPILAFSALAQDRDVQRGRAAGADDYLTKPFSSEVLLQKVAALLGG